MAGARTYRCVGWLVEPRRAAAFAAASARYLGGVTHHRELAMTQQQAVTDFLDIDEVARILGYRSTRSLRNRIYRRLSVPAYIQVPGSRSIFFRREDVIGFLNQHRIDGDDTRKTSVSRN